MRLIDILTVGTSLIGSIQTAPVPDPDPKSIWDLLPKKHVHDCGKSTWYNDTSVNSPLASDCMVVVRNIENGGSWNVENFISREHQLVQYGTCAFSVAGGEPNALATYYNVGNEDIRSAIIESVNRYTGAGSGRVGAWGRFHCQGGAPSYGYDVKWRIFPNR